MTDGHYHLIYFADTTVYTTLKLERGDAIDAVSRYMTNMYGRIMPDGGADEEMQSQLQLKLASMNLDQRLFMERDDPLTVGMKFCNDNNCKDAPVMS